METLDEQDGLGDVGGSSNPSRARSFERDPAGVGSLAKISAEGASRARPATLILILARRGCSYDADPSTVVQSLRTGDMVVFLRAYFVVRALAFAQQTPPLEMNIFLRENLPSI